MNLNTISLRALVVGKANKSDVDNRYDINPKIVLDGLELGIDGYLVEQQTTKSSTSLKFQKIKTSSSKVGSSLLKP